MADKDSARDAIYAAIEKVARDVDNLAPSQRGAAVANVALAWRYVVGGPQPGGTPTVS